MDEVLSIDIIPVFIWRRLQLQIRTPGHVLIDLVERKTARSVLLTPHHMCKTGRC